MVTNTGEITSTTRDVCVCFVSNCEPFSVETICRITFNRSNQFLAVVFVFGPGRPVASLNFLQFVTTTGNKCVVVVVDGGHAAPLSIQTKRQQQFVVIARHHETNQFPVERFNQRQLEFRCGRDSTPNGWNCRRAASQSQREGALRGWVICNRISWIKLGSLSLKQHLFLLF